MQTFAIDVVLDLVVSRLRVPDFDRCAIEQQVREEERIQGRCVGQVQECGYCQVSSC